MEKVKLKKENRDKWLEALRSGEYNQAKETLYNPYTYSFCCLGVYCHIKGIDNSNITGLSYPSEVKEELLEEHNIDETIQYSVYDFTQTLPNGKTLSLVELWENHKEFIKKQITKRNFSFLLSQLNDDGYTFEQIANIIEETTIGV